MAKDNDLDNDLDNDEEPPVQRDRLDRCGPLLVLVFVVIFVSPRRHGERVNCSRGR